MQDKSNTTMTRPTARTHQGMNGPDRGENADKRHTTKVIERPSGRPKVVALQRILGSGSPGARTPNLRNTSLLDHTADNRISSDCNGFRPTQTIPEPSRPVRKGQTHRARKGHVGARRGAEAPRQSTRDATALTDRFTLGTTRPLTKLLTPDTPGGTAKARRMGEGSCEASTWFHLDEGNINAG
jgi:hypothetical protein